MIQPPLIPDPVCTCHPLCDEVCRGDCGCIACQCAYGDGKCHPATCYAQLMEIARRADA